MNYLTNLQANKLAQVDDEYIITYFILKVNVNNRKTLVLSVFALNGLKTKPFE